MRAFPLVYAQFTGLAGVFLSKLRSRAVFSVGERLTNNKLRIIIRERSYIMAENCTHDCSSCSSNCSSRKKESMLKPPHAQSSIKKVIGVVSG